MGNWSIESEVGRSILYGSLSGLATSLLLQPLDRVKTLVQQTDNRRTPTSDIVRSTVRKDGVLSLWKGLSPTILRIVPGIALYFGFVTTAKQFVPESTMYQNFLIGFASRTSVALILQPTTVLKARLESSVYSRRNLADELRNILRTEGPAGLWRATLPTILRDAPFSGLYLAFYRYQLSLIGVEGSHTAPVLRLTCGMISGLVACLFTHPFDVIKTRIQLYPRMYDTFGGAVRRVYKDEGFSAFFRGFWLRAARRALASALAWAFFDELARRR